MSKRGMDDGMQVGQAGGRVRETVATRVKRIRGIETVPNGWDAIPLKSFLRLRIERYNDELPLLSVYRDHGVVPFGSIEGNHNKPSIDLSNYKTVRKGDLVLNKMKTWQGSLAISGYEGIVSPAYVVCRVSGDWDHRYLHHLLRSPSFIAEYASLSYGIRVGQWDMRFEDFREVLALRPPVDMQHLIADYLDSETARIDALIDRKQRFIDLLLEKRAALITHAVTKGLDPGAEMRDSGHAELGLIPAHWRVMRVRHLFRNLDGRRIPLSAEDRSYRQGSYDYYGASGVIDHIDDYIFDEPLVLIGEDGANLVLRSTPLAFVATGKYWVNNHAHVMRPLDGSPHYWTAALNVIDYTPLIVGSAQPKLTQADLADVPLPVPPPAEITATCEYIERESAAIDRLVTKTRRSIALLREYRTALVSAAVTGQIDIPGTETSEDVA